MTKAENGVWSFTSAPVPPGAYRYNINVGVATIDPRNPLTSVSNNNVWSLALVPDRTCSTRKKCRTVRSRRSHATRPRSSGTAACTSTRRPGMGRQRTVSVFYLLHGAGDSDEAWTSVGRAGIILDNLIAAKKAQPMIVVMPMGHTNGPLLGMGAPPAPINAPDAPPTTSRGLQSRAQAIHREATGEDGPRESRHRGSLDGRQPDAQHRDSEPERLRLRRRLQFRRARRRWPRTGAAPAATPPPFGEAWRNVISPCSTTRLPRRLKLFWLSTGKDDFLIETSRSTVKLLERHGFTPKYVERAATPG